MTTTMLINYDQLVSLCDEAIPESPHLRLALNFADSASKEAKKYREMYDAMRTEMDRVLFIAKTMPTAFEIRMIAKKALE